MRPNKKFLIADPHFGHEKTCTDFRREDGTLLRPFASAADMDREMIERWNAVVGDHDKVYVLGDVVINQKNMPILKMLKGKKKLIMGNHDIFPAKDYLEFFYELSAFKKEGRFALTHIPLHPESLGLWSEGNIHGHLHERRVLLPNGQIDTRYFCVSVEQINYTPIEFTELVKRIEHERVTNPRLDQSTGGDRSVPG